MRRPLFLTRRHIFWLTYHGALLTLWCLLLLPALWEASFGGWGAELSQPLPSRATAQLAQLEAHLNSPFEDYSRRDVLDDNFKVVALSHMAYGMMSVATAEPKRAPQLVPLIREVTRRALDPRVSPYRRPLSEVKDLGDDNLYLSHLNLILGVHRHITADSEHDALHTRVSKHLVKKSLADGDGHARSYPRPAHKKDRASVNKWPADQAVTLASLFLYDMTRDEKLSAKPIRAWLKEIQRAQRQDETLKLPHSSLDEGLGYAKLPRGCALSWMVLYMAQFAPEEAAALYERYRGAYSAEVLGLGGFREWPPGQDRGSDVDSGPVILGVGMAATGLGLGPARLMRDERQYATILSTASTLGLPVVLGPRRVYLTAPLLGESILWSGSTARVWFGEGIKDTPYRESSLWPFGSWILLFVLGALIVYSLSSVREVWRDMRR